MTISISSRKAKARRLQNSVAEAIREHLKCHADDVRPAIMGESGIDIRLSPAVRERFCWGIECKAQESIAIWDALRQCEANAKKAGLKPVLAFKRSRSETYVVLRLEDWLGMVR